jgi:hypothetical protein
MRIQAGGVVEYEGIKYLLHIKTIPLNRIANGERYTRDVYFFSKDDRSPDLKRVDIPEGYSVKIKYCTVSRENRPQLYKL